MSQYAKSTTTVTDESIAVLVSCGIAKPWTNPRTGKTRYYIDEEGLGRLIGLSVERYGTGCVSGCSYADAEGEEVTVAHSRAWGAYDKCYIEDGTVWCTWQPYGENIAELVAFRISETEQDEGEAEVSERPIDQNAALPSDAESIRAEMVAKLEAEAARISSEPVQARPDRKFRGFTLNGATVEEVRAEREERIARIGSDIEALMGFDDPAWFIDNARYAGDGWGIPALSKRIRAHAEYIESRNSR